MSDDALLTQARDLGGRMGSAAVAPYWRELTRRNPTDAVLVEAQFGVGLSMRVTKKHEQEEATFLEVVRVAGPDSPRAQDAMFQVAWSRHFRDDFEGALHAMEEVATSPRRSDSHLLRRCPEEPGGAIPSCNAPRGHRLKGAPAARYERRGGSQTPPRPDGGERKWRRIGLGLLRRGGNRARRPGWDAAGAR